jgi:hypothetical protein
MSNLIDPSAEEMKLALIDAFESQESNSLGYYSRPNGLPDIPAIIVGRLLPKGYKVVVAPLDQDPIPALEVIVDYFPEFRIEPGNFSQPALAEAWRIYLVFHDDRQFPRSAIRAIVQNFQIVGEISSLPANDQRPHQYQLLITYKNRLKQRGR